MPNQGTWHNNDSVHVACKEKGNIFKNKSLYVSQTQNFLLKVSFLVLLK